MPNVIRIIMAIAEAISNLASIIAAAVSQKKGK